jgi:hypothetical protein
MFNCDGTAVIAVVLCCGIMGNGCHESSLALLSTFFSNLVGECSLEVLLKELCQDIC